ncbi:5'-methylthioadenosine/S-adenosylhomocysteine nucleosidase [Planococcus versutus]|uniref:5'-methylthioadenosine/S-adenosylhomocysteine nucleosidase n=1 Tax=Planococcus versutus TaxID=1302659 RepID=A0A1B1RXD3_9BACL|nr:5'-methylthioadenosine/S-adenosylhomocysteine nucleosidase [Planococcus versutus]ANU25592.1 5'-methylthioadenosine/S-adenosylhomocysteine nucleosidase [Planococcus versutus]
MKIGIIGAMEEEVQLLRSRLQNAQTEETARCEFTLGTYEKQEIVLLKSGIGKVNAAMATTILLQHYQPDIVINIGSAGGFDEELEVGTVIISDEVRHHDVDVTVFGYEIGQVPQLPAAFVSNEELIELAIKAVQEIAQHEYAVGLIATGDSFMNDPQRVLKVRTDFPAMKAADMEAAAVAQVCYQFDVAFVVIRALSDIAGKESSVSFEEFLPLAAKHSTEIVLNVIGQLAARI